MESDTLPEAWSWSTLNEIVDPYSKAIVSGPFGSNIGSRFFVESGVPVIRGNNLTTDMTRFIDDGFVFVTEEKADELKNCDAIIDDLIFTAAGSLGQVGIIPNTAKYSRYIISNKQLRARVDKQKVDPLFVFYWLSSKEMVKYIQQRNTGSSVPLINLSVLRSLPIPLPPLPEQRAIAHILSTLDDKIELNRQMNETLEAMVRAIFKSWFVDFDPVRAKAEGRDTGLPEEIAALFPDSFEETEIGEVPEGWKISKLSNVCEYIMSGGTPSTQIPAYWDGDIPWLSSGETRNCFITKTEKTITNLGVEKSSTRLARAKSTVIAAAGQGHTRGQTSLLLFDSYINQSVVALAADSKQVSDYYLFFNLSGRYEELRQISDSHSSRGSLTTKLLNNLDIIIPSLELVSKFSQFTEAVVGQIQQNLLQSSMLTELRDTLLPKLISGELRINNTV